MKRGLSLVAPCKVTSLASKHSHSLHWPTALGLLRAKHIRFVLPSASDSTSAESGVNRLLLFTTAEPLSTFLRIAATWAHRHRVQFQVEHLAGERNTWADALSRGRLQFIQHRSAECVRITLPQSA